MPQVIRHQDEVSEVVAVALSDSVNDNAGKNYYFNRLYAATAGLAATVLENDVVVNIPVAIGMNRMPPFKRINGTNTTATGLIAGVTF